MQRLLPASLLLGALVSPSHASEDLESYEVLVGWSADGERYAVIKSYRLGDGPFLEVRDRDKVVATFKDGDKDVPDYANGKAGVERVAIASWKPITSYRLLDVTSTARTRFTDAYTAAATGGRTSPTHCPNGGVTVTPKSGAKASFTHRPAGDHCFQVLGGYLDRDGKHALVKVREVSRLPRGATQTETKFIHVELPRASTPAP